MLYCTCARVLPEYNCRKFRKKIYSAIELRLHPNIYPGLMRSCTIFSNTMESQSRPHQGHFVRCTNRNGVAWDAPSSIIIGRIIGGDKGGDVAVDSCPAALSLFYRPYCNNLHIPSLFSAARMAYGPEPRWLTRNLWR
jgi:hypothetical protein